MPLTDSLRGSSRAVPGLNAPIQRFFPLDRCNGWKRFRAAGTLRECVPRKGSFRGGCWLVKRIIE